MLAHQHGFIVVNGTGQTYGGIKSGQTGSSQSVNATDRYTTGGVASRVGDVNRGKRKGVKFIIKVL